MSESVEMLLTLKIFHSNICSPDQTVDCRSPERQHLHIPQFPDDGDVRELGAPAVELLDLVHVADPGPCHDHVLG